MNLLEYLPAYLQIVQAISDRLDAVLAHGGVIPVPAVSAWCGEMTGHDVCNGACIICGERR